MNENALRVEMGIPLHPHPKHTYAKIGGQIDSDSEYSSNSEDELDNLIQYSKQVESNSTKIPKSVRPGAAGLLIGIEYSRIRDSLWMYLTSFVTTRIGVELPIVVGLQLY